MRSFQIEQFHPSHEISFEITVYDSLFIKNNNPNAFRMHEEFELTAIFNGSGKRLVGNSINNFSNGDLFLLGPNLPHLLKVDHPEESSAVCIHFAEDSFGPKFFKKPQNLSILKMLNEVSLGCHFYGAEASLIKEELKLIPSLDPFEKMLTFLKVLYRLSKTSHYKLLSTPGYKPVLKKEEANRISLIYNYIIDNFDKKLNIEELSSLIHVSHSTFYRQFKKSMNKNFSDFIAEVRIGHACKLLLDSDMDIAEICYLSGYQQITNFNRQFKKLKGTTPNIYRKNY